VFPSEREVADILDSLGVRWEYEPTLFELHKSKKGYVKEAFRPDFYLPEYDYYIEVTKAKQSNVTRKNRKVRTVKEKFPGMGIDLIYLIHFDNLHARVLEILEHAEQRLGTLSGEDSKPPLESTL
jgi:hypothetical protein